MESPAAERDFAGVRKPHITYVDGLRAIAVLTVLFFHGFEVADGVFSPRLISLFRGVNLFFAISGFCLAFPFLSALRSGRPLALDARTYVAFLLRRFSRIAPPYYVALTLFLLLGLTAFGFPDAGGRVPLTVSLHEYAADLAFLTPRVPLINVAFWTLGVEARWYLVCPLLVALYARSRIGFCAVGLGLYLLYFLSPYAIADEGTLPCFMVGIIAADAVIMGWSWTRFAWIGAVAFLALAIWTSGGDFGDPIWHAACFFLIVAGSRGLVSRALQWRPLVFVGVASYSIYLYHAPVLESLVRNGWPRPLATAGALAAGILAWALVERYVASKASRSAIEGAIRRAFAWPASLRGRRAAGVLPLP